MENIIEASLCGYVQRGVESAQVSDGRLIMTLTDGAVLDLGPVRGEKGDKGDKGDGASPLLLEWHSGGSRPTAAEIAANSAVLSLLASAPPGTYSLFLDVSGRRIGAATVYGACAWFADFYGEQSVRVYYLGLTGPGGSYEQRTSVFPEETFDEFSPAPASMTAIAEYVDGRIGTTGDIDLSLKRDVPSLVSSGAEITLADNTEYRLTDVSSLVLAFPAGNFECWLRLSFAASGEVSVTFPAGARFIGTTPSFANGEVWEVSVKDGIVAAAKAVSA